MEEDVHEYNGEDVAVSFDSNRCIHARECVEGLPTVFDVDRRPWVDPDGDDAEAVAAVVERCPTGALHYERLDGGPGERSPDQNVVTAVEDGPLYLHGDVDIQTVDEESVLRDTRVGLCRCGHADNKPLCDNSHNRVFTAGGVDPGDAVPDPDADPEGGDETGAEPLRVTLVRNGPLRLEGQFTLRTGDGDPTEHSRATLCRCGASADKPFCDNSHTSVDFSTGEGE